MPLKLNKNTVGFSCLFLFCFLLTVQFSGVLCGFHKGLLSTIWDKFLIFKNVFFFCHRQCKLSALFAPIYLLMVFSHVTVL